ncbi:hypothetical protein AKJ16_DCAP05100 [Drosera capensis]
MSSLRLDVPDLISTSESSKIFTFRFSPSPPELQRGFVVARLHQVSAALQKCRGEVFKSHPDPLEFRVNVFLDYLELGLEKAKLDVIDSHVLINVPLCRLHGGIALANVNGSAGVIAGEAFPLTAVVLSAITSCAASFATDSAGLSDIVSSSEHGLSSQLDDFRWNDPCIFIWEIKALRKVIRVHLDAYKKTPFHKLSNLYEDLRSCHSGHLPAFEAQCFSRREMKLLETSLELVICTEQQSDLEPMARAKKKTYIE